MKNKGTVFKHILLLLALVLCMGAENVWAAERIDTSRTGSLSLSYPVGGIPFRLYKVADLNADGQLAWTEQFSRYADSISLDQQDQSGWEAVAQTLSAYSSRDRLTPYAQQNTDAAGKLTFSIGEVGMYLVDWDTHRSNGQQYTPGPNLVTIPMRMDDGTWLYDLTSEVKYGVVASAVDNVDRKVHKAWDDNQDASKSRPESIEAQLLCDGEVYDTVTLNADNSWSHEWKDLDAKRTWKVVEKEVPSGYTTKTRLEGTTFLMTNTKKPGGTTPGGSTPPGGTRSSSRLPQTGMLWWPVPLLAMIGLLLFAMGWRLYRRGQENE